MLKRRAWSMHRTSMPWSGWITMEKEITSIIILFHSICWIDYGGLRRADKPGLVLPVSLPIHLLLPHSFNIFTHLAFSFSPRHTVFTFASTWIYPFHLDTLFFSSSFSPTWLFHFHSATLGFFIFTPPHLTFSFSLNHIVFLIFTRPHRWPFSFFNQPDFCCIFTQSLFFTFFTWWIFFRPFWSSTSQRTN